MSFTRVDAKHIAEALGDITQLPKDVKMAVTNRLDESFQSVPIPNSGDWLYHHEEKGQTMESFERNADKAFPHGTHTAIYIQPVGNFDSPRAAPLTDIIKFVRTFFAPCDAEILGITDFSKDMISRTNNSTQKIQYRTDGFHNYLRRARSQRNTKRELLCVAVTMADIYPDESWNFVYGEALPNEGVGVYSFARLDPLFFSSSQNFHTISLTEEHRVIIFRRCLKILLHEIGHLFGLEHCIYYTCLMNGANNEKEMDRQPLYLCPVCLRKLYSILQFDVRQRYEKLAKLCEKYGLEEESIWYRKRLDCIQE